MKRIKLICGLVLTIGIGLFQNCAQSNFETVSDIGQHSNIYEETSLIPASKNRALATVSRSTQISSISNGGATPKQQPVIIVGEDPKVSNSSEPKGNPVTSCPALSNFRFSKYLGSGASSDFCFANIPSLPLTAIQKVVVQNSKTGTAFEDYLTVKCNPNGMTTEFLPDVVFGDFNSTFTQNLYRHTASQQCAESEQSLFKLFQKAVNVTAYVYGDSQAYKSQAAVNVCEGIDLIFNIYGAADGVTSSELFVNGVKKGTKITIPSGIKKELPGSQGITFSPLVEKSGIYNFEFHLIREGQIIDTKFFTLTTNQNNLSGCPHVSADISNRYHDRF